MSSPSPARHQTATGSKISASVVRLLIGLVLFVSLLIVVATQTDGLAVSLAALRRADTALVVLAVVMVAGSYVAAACSYYILGGPTIRFLPTLSVQIVSGLTNRLLPAGLGGLGVFALYFRRQGRKLAAASALVVTNNILGFVGSGLWVIAVLLLQPALLQELRLPDVNGVLVPLLITVAALVAAVVYARRVRRSGRLAVFLRDAVQALGHSLRPNPTTAGSLICNILLTGLTVTAFYLCVLASGGTVSWPAALLVVLLGNTVGAVIPTPGGIGGVEAGLIAGLYAFGVDASTGIAAVFLFRGLSYWLPMVPGLLMFRFVEKRYL